MASEAKAEHSNINLPIEKLDECRVCKKTNQLKLCARCHNVIYCSKECGDKDWFDGHKKSCVKVKRIDLEQIYPFLAGVAVMCRTTRASPTHPASYHRITNEPNPDSPAAIQRIPGSQDNALLVRLGDPVTPQQCGTSTWWPKALSDQVRRKLWRRITWEGYAFHVHFATAFALLDQFYAQGEFRLKYKTSPISDFGLAHGKLRVTEGDRLAYVLPDGTVQRGPDPNDHWWIWFKTARGEELTLDFGTHAWNLCMMVNVENHLINGPLDWVPATFKNRGLSKAPGANWLYTEDRRVTILRDPELGKLATDHPGRLPAVELIEWAEQNLLRRKVTAVEEKFMPEWIEYTDQWMQRALDNGDWKKWPAEPTIGMDLDPEEERTQARRGF